LDAIDRVEERTTAKSGIKTAIDIEPAEAVAPVAIQRRKFSAHYDLSIRRHRHAQIPIPITIKSILLIGRLKAGVYRAIAL
jgi:hypothetical protein